MAPWTIARLYRLDPIQEVNFVFISQAVFSIYHLYGERTCWIGAALN